MECTWNIYRRLPQALPDKNSPKIAEWKDTSKRLEKGKG